MSRRNRLSWIGSASCSTADCHCDLIAPQKNGMEIHAVFLFAIGGQTSAITRSTCFLYRRQSSSNSR